MRSSGILIRTGVLFFAAILLQSCATLFTSSPGSYKITGIRPEERENGYIFRIEASGRIGKVEAWIGPDNWLYMTIPDTNLDAGSISNLTRCPIVSNMRFFKYKGSVQVTLHLNQKFDHTSVLNYANDDNVYVVLYKFKE